MKTKFVVLLLVIMFGVMVLPAQEKAKKIKKNKKANIEHISFKSDVFPIIKTYCLSCHAEDKMSPSELDLDTYEQLMKGGKHGVAVIPEKADSSLIVQKLSGKPPFGDPMPMKRKGPFPEDTLKILKTWINQGAKDN